MKRLISFFILTALFVLSLLSCSGSDIQETTGGVTAASASASEYAVQLWERLGCIPDNIIVGIGDGSEYGVDLTDFEDDGYIIRSIGKNTVIFGKTAAGLDLAIRRYANETELYGKAQDVICHEGYRIDFLTLFDTPVDDFVIEYNNSNSKRAASELQRLLNIACGAGLSTTSNNNGHPHVIRIKESKNDSLKNNGFRYFEDNGSLIIEGAGENGCLLGVYSFLENECGWNGLTVGDSILSDTHILNIPAGIDTTVVPAFDFVAAHPTLDESYTTDRLFPLYIYSSANTDFFADVISGDSICFSSDETFSAVQRYITEFADSSTDVIDLSPLMEYGHCDCDTCDSILRTEESTLGSAVRFFNNLADELADSYPDITYKLTVRDNITAPLITKPSDKLHIAFELTGFCINHTLDASPCNSDCSSALESWLGVTDKVSVILVKDSADLRQYTLIHTLYANIKHLHNSGVIGIYFDVSTPGLGTERIEYLLIDMMCRNIDMTEEEFNHSLELLLRKEYGLGWESIAEYLGIWTEAETEAGCITSSNDPADVTLTLQNYNTSLSLLEDAERLVENTTQLERCTLFSCHMIYNKCRATYFSEYFAGNADGIAKIEELYSYILDILEANDITPEYGDLYTAAWHDWVKVKDKLYSGDEGFSPSEKYINFAKRVSAKTGKGKLTFAFKTDSHFTKGKNKNAFISFANIQHYVPLDFYVHGGDLINGNHPTEEIAIGSYTTAFNSMIPLHSAPFVSLRGNHDDNSWTFCKNSSTIYGIYPDDGILDSSEWCTYGFTRSSKIVTDGKGAYGYMDHEETKIRVLFVDTSDLPYTADDDGMCYYGSYTGNGIRNDQLNFMAKAMAFEDKGDDAKNWAILIFSHIPIETFKLNDAYRFGSKEVLGRNFLAFLRIVEAYKNGTAINDYHYARTNYGDGGYNFGYNSGDIEGDFAYSVKADYSKNGPGEVIGFISGHTHLDNYSNRVGYGSYTNTFFDIYPELSLGYSYFTFSSDGFAVISVERNGDGTGTISVDKYGSSVVSSEDLISPGDNAGVTTDPIMKGIYTATPDSGSVASGSYTVKYSQPAKRQ